MHLFFERQKTQTVIKKHPKVAENELVFPNVAQMAAVR